MDASHHMTSKMNKDKNNDASFVANSKLKVAQGVTVTLENGKIMRHKANSTADSQADSQGQSSPNRDVDSQYASMTGAEDIIVKETNSISKFDPVES